MAKKGFKCGTCGRSFLMAAHLARHVSTTHGAGGKSSVKKGAAKRGKMRAAGRPLARPMMAAGSPSFVHDMRAYHDSLVAERDALEGRIVAVQNAIAALNGSAGGPAVHARPAVRVAVARGPKGRPGKKRGGGGRRPEGGALRDFVIKVLRASDAPLGVKEISSRVIAAGYPTASKDLSKAVSNMLPNVKEVKRVDRGLYRA